jgi:hypothetical protein
MLGEAQSLESPQRKPNQSSVDIPHMMSDNPTLPIAIKERLVGCSVLCDCQQPMVYVAREHFPASMLVDPLLQGYVGVYRCPRYRCLCHFFV